jgi:hypothetical protein
MKRRTVAILCVVAVAILFTSVPLIKGNCTNGFSLLAHDSYLSLSYHFLNFGAVYVSDGPYLWQVQPSNPQNGWHCR